MINSAFGIELISNAEENFIRVTMMVNERKPLMSPVLYQAYHLNDTIP